ncbi:MAG TPA: hypothetical protein VIK86_06800 [Candidatus Paceibacterota bacterium]
MKMENNEKVNCCEHKEGNSCEHIGHGCCGWKKCHMMKLVLIVIIIIAAFCMGAQWGQMRAYIRNGGGASYGTGMMNWYK